jgi:serine/threonine protein kinase
VQDPLVGTIVDGKYQVTGRIGAGGMGTVYRAVHVSLGAPRALKVMRRELVGDPDLAERFRSEARLAEGLRHPSLVALYDFGQIPDRGWYIVSELVEGATLAVLLRRRDVRFPSADVARLVGQVADGLGLAHRRGVVHRDISPDNIMLAASDDGEVVAKLLDFGIAKDTLAAPGGSTGVGWNMGKVGFSSPEQMGLLREGERIDARADVFSLAAVAYFMLNARLPWRRDGVQAYTHDLLLRPEPELLDDIRAHAPEPWHGLFVAALARVRDQRLSGMAALREGLAGAARAMAEAGTPEPPAFGADRLRSDSRDDDHGLVTRTLGEGSPAAPAAPTAASAPAATPPARSPAGPVLVPSAILPQVLSALEWEGEPAAELAGPTRRRVVFVDDDEALREVLPALLAGRDLDVRAVPWDADPGPLAGNAPPALLLADAGLDEARAIRRIERLRGVSPEGTPIVLFSSADPWTLRERSRALGLFGFLSKEALGGDLVGAVERLLGQSAAATSS